MSLKQKPAENTALIVGAVVAVGEAFHIKVDAALVTKALAVAPLAVGVVPHVVTATVDYFHGRKAAAKAEFDKAIADAVAADRAAHPQATVVGG